MSQIVISATLTFKPDFRDEGLEKLKYLHVKTHANDEGCLQYDLHVNQEDENTFTFLETWESEEALQKHSEAEHFKEVGEFLEDKLVSTQIEKLTKIA